MNRDHVVNKEPPAQQIQSRADVVAIGLSVGCLLHCLALPLAVALLPTLPIDWLTDEQFHRWLLVAILPTSVVALLLGCWKHRQVSVVVMGVAGLLLLIWAAIYGHDVAGELGEKAVTAVGAVVIAASHVMNLRSCRAASCAC